ncbi:hypothetical protein, partial [uncultured Brevundimonas sp.]|uniref:hypothetical protein n=1 Tax=uncultured Brevundimonas sp. TaxID=213418 RepID=UPI0025D635D6
MGAQIAAIARQVTTISVAKLAVSSGNKVISGVAATRLTREIRMAVSVLVAGGAGYVGSHVCLAL